MRIEGKTEQDLAPIFDFGLFGVMTIDAYRQAHRLRTALGDDRYHNSNFQKQTFEITLRSGALPRVADIQATKMLRGARTAARRVAPQHDELWMNGRFGPIVQAAQSILCKGGSTLRKGGRSSLFKQLA